MRGYHIEISVKPQGPKAIPNTFVPRNLFAPLPSHTPKPTTRRNATFNPRNKDYRFGPIRVDWMDLESPNHKAPNSPAKERAKQKTGTLEAVFVPNDNAKSGSTNLPEGVVHIYRDVADRPSSDEPEASTSASVPASEDSDGVMLGVLAVPAWMTPSDFLSFVAPATDGISHLRLVRDSSPNRSIAIIKFRHPADASEFIEAFNGKHFNSMQPEICNVVHVVSVKVTTEDAVTQAVTRSQHSQNRSLYELPTCPVCLERMDSAITGLITVPCSHTFHCECLSKWGDSRCPVCRYSQTLRSSHPASSSSSRPAAPLPFINPDLTSLSTCASCSSTTNLWICLVCGNVGCGRYGRAHAHAHYELTTHLYALELETQRVWDYAGDGYVHRLILNKADGKLVELPSAASSAGVAPRDNLPGPSQADALTAEKIEAIGIEYSYLLTSQLDSQRSYYEEQTVELQSQIHELRGLVERLSLDFDIEKTRTEADGHSRAEEEGNRLNEVLKEKAKAETRAQKATDLARLLDKELKEERAVSDGLMKNLSIMKQRMEQVDAEKDELAGRIQDLEDQLRDVMFSLETRDKIEQGGGLQGELAGGSIEVAQATSQATNDTRRKGRKR